MDSTVTIFQLRSSWKSQAWKQCSIIISLGSIPAVAGQLGMAKPIEGSVRANQFEADGGVP